MARQSPSALLDLSSLPPTKAAYAQHSLRVYLQGQEWLGNRLPSTEWGWKFTQNLNYLDSGCGDKTRTQKQGCIQLKQTHPDLPPLNQGTISKIEAQYREMGHVGKVPSKRQAVVDDDTKLNLLLALEENPIIPARQLTRDTLGHENFEELATPELPAAANAPANADHMYYRIALYCFKDSF
ncbi:hypothetical protein NQ318_011453 [Aromia moschata]|uniref:Uncharacterized protein n=1 Tax=Aromia moschata TaxID=1265417 RepID=A0AAV8X8G0_9CUCU|nr:hypothetical protein NQ318_011453 [Aromia moschata]